MVKLIDILQGYIKAPNFDRAEYYEKYMRNLLPKSIKITRKDHTITITVK